MSVSLLLHWVVQISISMVQLALAGSVLKISPPENFQNSQVFSVPASNSPFSARARAPGTWSRIQPIFVAL